MYYKPISSSCFCTWYPLCQLMNVIKMLPNIIPTWLNPSGLELADLMLHLKLAITYILLWYNCNDKMISIMRFLMVDNSLYKSWINYKFVICSALLHYNMLYLLYYVLHSRMFIVGGSHCRLYQGIQHTTRKKVIVVSALTLSLRDKERLRFR